MNVILDNDVNLQNYRPDYPVLIVRGKVEIKVNPLNLSESDYSHNYNPIGAPYQGQTDSDQFDQYPSEINGLVHATGEIKFMVASSKVVGTVISDGTVKVEENPQIIHDPNLVVDPPQGYAKINTGGEMRIVPGSWRKVMN